MFNADVDAHLQMIQQDRGLAIHAFVAADPGRTLRWRLVVASRSAGGTSNVSQGGTTDGASDQPVGVVGLSPNSQGSVTLSVFDGEREVASDLISFGEAAPEAASATID